MGNLPVANKKLGQHFLINENVIQTICEDHSEACDVIVEVGPGPGVLTKYLALKNKPLFLIEKDHRFESELQKYTATENIHFQDALKFDWIEFLEQQELKDKKIWLVSNLPYNVGTILFTQFLQIKPVQFMTLMFQKEVGQKTYMREIKNQLSGLLFLSFNYMQSKQLIKVSPGSFSPPPKVDSIVVSYTRKNNPDIPIEEFKALDSFLRLVFGMKRKQLISVMKSRYATESITQLLGELNISPTIRAEALTYPQLLSIYLKFKSH